MAYSGLRLLGIACHVGDHVTIFTLLEMELSVIAKVRVKIMSTELRIIFPGALLEFKSNSKMR